MERKIKWGLPKGSLNTPGRGDTQKVLLDAGYLVRGYESGKESVKELSILNDPEIIARLVRPQNVPSKLRERFLDIAITGDDWYKEDRVNNEQNGVRKIGDLEYGQTRLIFAVLNDSRCESLSEFLLSLRERKEPIRCFTEYVNLTRQAFMQNEVYQTIYGNKAPLVEIRGSVSGENELVKIFISDGATEGCIAEGADIIVDNTQSGKSLRENNLKELERIMESSTGLYAGPSCTGWKESKARWIFRSLEGAIKGKKMDDVKFNVPIPYVGKVREYLVVAELCADEPTITLGESFAAVNILIPKMIYPRTIQTLVEDYSASAVVRKDVDQYIK